MKYQFLSVGTVENRISALKAKQYCDWTYSDVLFYFFDTDHDCDKQDFIKRCRQDDATLKYWGLI